MTLLSDVEIDQMRTVCDQTLAGTAVIKGGTIVDDSGGGGTASWVARGTVACHLAPLVNQGDEMIVAGRLTAESQWILTLPAETNVTATDQIVIGGITYEVEALRAPRTWELTRRVELSQVT